MNCCDEKGDCRQGRDCPVRNARLKEIEDQGEPLTQQDFEEIITLSVIAVIVVAVMIYAGWHLPEFVAFMWRLLS